MIPRLKPAIGGRELRAAWQADSGNVARFEREFAGHFEAREAIAFSYGRSALWALLKALGLANAEVVMPAYTCVAVAHATVLSGNTPVFVDVRPDDYNIDLDQLADALTPATRVVVPTHLFGCPMNVDRVEEIVRTAETRWGQKIWIVQDCAHAFGARWRGQRVSRRRDAALFGLNISKAMTSIFGGMITTDDERLAAAVRAVRDREFVDPRAWHALRQGVYLTLAAAAFSRPLYGLTEWLQHSTPALDRLTKAYHLETGIQFPPDAMRRMAAGEAGVGRVQLARYEEMEAHRIRTAAAYDDALRDVPGLALPPKVPGSTYSHYAVRVPDRAHVCRVARRLGVELGTLIEYSIPERPDYASYAGAGAFPVARACSTSTVNLPVHMGVTAAVRRRVADAVRAAMGEIQADRRVA